MKQQVQHDTLDRLLAQSSQIADRGFTEQLQVKLGKASRTRPWIFAAAGVAWALLALMAVSYEEALFLWQQYLNLSQSIVATPFLSQDLVNLAAAMLRDDYVMLSSLSLACVALGSLLRLGRA